MYNDQDVAIPDMLLTYICTLFIKNLAKFQTKPKKNDFEYSIDMGTIKQSRTSFILIKNRNFR